MPCRTMSTESMVNRVAAEDGADAWVNLVVHSLDARLLRQCGEHAALSRLAECRAVRMIASVDHPDSALLHDFKIAQCFQSCWHHVPTLLPLWSETWEIEPVIQPRQASAVHLDAVPVLQTLTQNSQHVRPRAALLLLSATPCRQWTSVQRWKFVGFLHFDHGSAWRDPFR